MAYIPSGFWSRLITRLIVSVQRWRAIEHIKEESYSLVYWREGIGVVYEGGHFQVESYQELVKYSLLVHRCLECKKIYVFRLFFVVVAVFIVVRLFVCCFFFLGNTRLKFSKFSPKEAVTSSKVNTLSCCSSFTLAGLVSRQWKGFSSM